MDALLSVNALAVGYSADRRIVSDLNFDLHPGEIVTLIGANGAGKSTVLKSVAAQLKPLSGSVFIEGKPESQMREIELARKLSLFLTGRMRTELMTCEDVVATGRYPYTGRLGILSREDWVKVDEAMHMTMVEELRNVSFTQISDGQRQRVMLARAVCQEPEILVLDEPTSYLDIRHKLGLLALIKQLAQEKKIAILMSLHELDLAERISDRLICIRDGRAERIGTPSEIFTGDYIRDLYGIESGSFSPVYGTPELERPAGEPAVFVIGGGGCGIPVYRNLQRQGRAFIAGVLHENDLEYPCALALAAQVITERAFEPIADDHLQKALALLETCREVRCPLQSFGTMNAANKLLRDRAGELGLLL